MRNYSNIQRQKGRLAEHINELITKTVYNMSQTFKLLKGEILFDEDKIIIKDDAKKQKWFWSLLLFFNTIYVGRTFVKSYQNGDQFDFWYGLILGLSGILLLVLFLLSSVRSIIPLKEVKSMKLKQRFSNKFLVIKLKNYRQRRVMDIYNTDALEQYIKTNLAVK